MKQKEKKNDNGMKIYPKIKKGKTRMYEQTLTPTQNLTRKIAIGIAFVSVFYFFVKLLFL